LGSDRVVRLVYAYGHDPHLCCDCDYILTGQVLLDRTRGAV
jgi:hypothetical protein